jgi:hypothetical protein
VSKYVVVAQKDHEMTKTTNPTNPISILSITCIDIGAEFGENDRSDRSHDTGLEIVTIGRKHGETPVCVGRVRGISHCLARAVSSRSRRMRECTNDETKLAGQRNEIM